MKEESPPSLSRMCSPLTSLAWIEPNGKIHWIGMTHTHGMWAFIYLHPNRQNDPYIPDSAQSSSELLESGWIRVSSVVDLDVRNIDSISQASWDAWSTIVASCARQVPPEKEMTVSTGSGIRDYFKIAVGDFIEKYCSKRASDAYWGKLMGESRRRKVPGRPSRINEFYEIHQAIEALSSLAPHIANYLDGMINAGNTKEQVLGILGKFRGYRDSLPQPIFRAMEIVVPGFRTIEDFESRVLQMSEEELDRRLGKLLLAIQSGRLAGSAMGESLVRSIVRMTLLEDLKGFQARTKDIDYMANLSDPTFEDPRQGSLVNKPLAIDVKRAWAAEADHKFMDSIIKIHWTGGLDWEKKLRNFLKLSGKNEISTSGYLPGSKEFVSSWGTIGVIVKGRTTLASNDMNTVNSGYHGQTPPETLKKYTSSGVPKRPLSFRGPSAWGGGSSKYILDRDSFDPYESRRSEFIVDNWKPVGIIVDIIDFLGTVQFPSVSAEPNIRYAEVVLELGLPVYDWEMKEIPKEKIEAALRGAGGRL